MATVYLAEDLKHKRKVTVKVLEGSGTAPMMTDDSQPSHFGGPLAVGLRSLPMLGDDLYLGMQVVNLAIVDGFLVNQESSLLAEYIREERTPLPSAVFVSALTQLWVFGLYEVLRTWRQRVNEVMSFTSELATLESSARTERAAAHRARLQEMAPFDGDDLRWRFFERAIDEPEYVSSLQVALDKSERLFRTIESLRVHLAKHEVPKVKGFSAMAPGYGRIHHENGSIYYQVLLRGDEVDVISRRDIADGCRGLTEDTRHSMLPLGVRPSMAAIAQVGYGYKRVIVTLSNGDQYSDVYVAWDREITAVGMHESQPFDAADVVEVSSPTHDVSRTDHAP